MSKITTFERWPRQLREKRGLLNGNRVQCARELRGLQRYELARKLAIPAKELAKREDGWSFWEEDEQKRLIMILSFPLAFFIQEDMPVLAPMFMSGYDAEGNHWCDVIDAEGKSMKVSRQKQIRDAKLQARVEQQAEVLAQRMKLGILCLECGEYCTLSEDGKRWLCPNGHNE